MKNSTRVDTNPTQNQEQIRRRVLSFIDNEFESDAAFERALGLGDKTVNNWRRGRSASYMKILPRLAEVFGVGISELLDMPLRKDSSELSDDEVRLLHQYRRSRTMPKEMRIALRETLETVIMLYLKSANEMKTAARERRKRDIERLTQKGGDNE